MIKIIKIPNKTISTIMKIMILIKVRARKILRTQWQTNSKRSINILKN